MLRATLLAASLALALALAGDADAATFTVNSDNDVADGVCGAHCSLRDAIVAANADTTVTTDEIAFAPPGPGGFVIVPATALPDVTDGVVINGSDAPGCGGDPENIALDGGGAAFQGLYLAAGSENSRVCMLGVRGFTNGLRVDADGAQIDGCRIGTTANGETADANSQNGLLFVGAANSVIAGNLISGNGFDGIDLGSSPDSTIAGNVLGLDKDGTDPIANGISGVHVHGTSTGTVVGGTDPADRNVIGGHPTSGVLAGAGQVIGNYVGTDVTGMTAIPNGIGVSANGPAQIGGATVAERNLISGNTIAEVSSSNAATIVGNWIGPNAAGGPMAPGAGADTGVQVSFDDTHIGPGNVILGELRGISTTSDVDGLVIEDNTIGLLPDGVTEAASAVGIELDAFGAGADVRDVTITGNRIAGTTTAGIRAEALDTTIDQNTIEPGTGDGVSVAPASAGVTVSENVIRGTGAANALAVDLDPDGVTPNDDGDADAGANALQNFPLLTVARPEGAGTRVEGTIDTTPGRPMRIELFSSAACGEADVLLGTTTVTSGSGPTPFAVDVAATPPGHHVTASATDETTGDTSELSACRAVAEPVADTTPTPATPAPGPAPPAVVPPPPFVPAVPKFPAKIRVLRNGVDDGVLDMLIEVTARAVSPGAVFSIDYESSGRHTRFTVPITGTQVKVRRRLPSSQPKDTGITTVTYAGNGIVLADDVRLRAADGKSLLTRGATSISGGRLVVDGTVADAARGVVRIRLGYNRPDGSTGFLDFRAPIDDGAWRISQPLTGDAARGGQLSIQFTGYEPRNLRGEQTAKEVLP